MPTRLLTDAELAQLAGYPRDIAADDLTTFFRLDSEDRRWLVEGHRGPGNRLGLALQLCTLRWLGFVPDDLTAAPADAVRRLADQLAIDPGALAGYGGWKDRTRTEHLREVLARLGWSTARAGALKVLDDFLLARALEHDSLTLLLQLASVAPARRAGGPPGPRGATAPRRRGPGPSSGRDRSPAGPAAHR